jgi:biopolymer transport protein TolR
MSMDVGGAQGGVKSDINVTPLVDVMLVLLIIMMLIAPMLQKGVDLTLPTASNTQQKPDTADQTVVYIDAKSRLYINALEKSEADLVSTLVNILEEKAEKTVYLKGDRDAPYGAIMKMMDALRGAQIDSVALITEKPGGNVADRKQGGQ